MNADTATIALYSDEFYALAHSDSPIRESYFAPVWEACGKCAGHGRIGIYLHRHDGICYDCKGYKGKMVSAKTQVSRCRTERKNHKKAQEVREATEKYMAEQGQWKTDHEDVVKSLEAMKGDFAADMRAALEYYGSLTEKQVAAVRRIAQEAAERAQNVVEVPEGRQVITGKILSVKRTESYYSYTPTVNFRATVEDDRGFRVNGNLPGAMINQFHEMWVESVNTTHEEEDGWTGFAQGQRITFTATLEPKDPGFAFFKRPSKASIL